MMKPVATKTCLFKILLQFQFQSRYIFFLKKVAVVMFCELGEGSGVTLWMLWFGNLSLIRKI